MDLAKQIVKEAKAEAKALLKAEEEEANSKLQELRKSLSSKLKEELKDFEEELKRRVVEEESKARLLAKKLLEQKKEETFQAALDEAIDAFLKSEDYASYLKESAQKVWEELGSDAEVHINKEDAHILEGAHVFTDLEDRGLKGVSKDGRVAMDFTLSSLIEKKSEELRRAFFKRG